MVAQIHEIADKTFDYVVIGAGVNHAILLVFLHMLIPQFVDGWPDCGRSTGGRPECLCRHSRGRQIGRAHV